MPIRVDVITPEKELLSEEVDFIAAPATEGEIGILPHHTPLLTKLGVGELRLKKGSEVKYLAINGGFLEVQSHSKVIILAETAEMADDIDEERARLAAERAKAELERARFKTDVNLLEAEASLERAINRVRIAQHRRGRIQRPGVN